MMRLLFTFFFAINLGLAVSGCSSQTSDAVDATDESLSNAKKSFCEKGECPCDSPLGSVAHGSKVTIYDVSSVACEGSCEQHAEVITCTNGKFDKEIEGKSFICRATECASCSVGTNLVRHGESIELFNSSEVDCDLSCEDAKQSRRCNNGKLLGDEAFSNLKCATRTCRCDLPDASGYLSLGGKQDYYSADKAACGQTCASLKATLTCGSTGTGASRTFQFTPSAATFKFASCKEATNCTCTLPDGRVILHGATATLDRIARPACGETCLPANRIAVRCENGVVKNSVNNSVIDVATTEFKYQCAPVTCKFCNITSVGKSVQHNEYFDFYTTSSPTCGNTCESKLVRRRCVDGNFEGAQGGDSATCSERLCKCDTGTVSIGVGQSTTFYEKDKATCTQPCESMSALRSCNEGGSFPNFTYAFSADATHTKTTCTPATNCMCTLPNGLGQIAEGATYRLHSQATVTCGTSCDQIPYVDVVCTGGQLRNQGEQVVDPATTNFKYLCAAPPTCANCTLPGYGSIESGSAAITLYRKEKLACGENPVTFAAKFECKSGVLSRNGSVYIPAQDMTAPSQYFTSMISDCKGCKTPWGVTIQEGQTTIAYKASGTVVNKCGKGCKSQEQKCSNGKLSGEADYDLGACPNSCNEEGGGAPPRGCLLPWQNSFITPGTEVPIWSKKTVPCGDSCQNYMKVGKCDIVTGRFNLPFEYIYQSCTELCTK